MGLYYDLLCPECGYKFNAMFGRGGDDSPAKEAEERFIIQKRGDEAAEVYWVIRGKGNFRPSVDYAPVPYYCINCNEFFQYNRIIIHGKGGVYHTNCNKCPNCSMPFIHMLQMEMLKGKEEYGYGECEQECPKCGHKLKVTSNGIYD